MSNDCGAGHGEEVREHAELGRFGEVLGCPGNGMANVVFALTIYFCEVRDSLVESHVSFSPDVLSIPAEVEAAHDNLVDIWNRQERKEW